ncbi:MAG TPA: hypothetical protein VFH02_10010 [Jiangellaceae bacterium]|nr:hypothetical protein [Jiangellaceae bacterium]
MRGLQRAAVVLMLGVLALSGCGGDDDPGASDADSAATDASSAEPTGEMTGETPGADSFCAEVEAARDQLDSVVDGETLVDPSAALDVVDDALETMRSIDPPAEIAEDWEAVRSFTEEMITALDEIDVTDPAALEDLGRDLEQNAEALQDAADRVDRYLEDECGITL